MTNTPEPIVLEQDSDFVATNYRGRIQISIHVEFDPGDHTIACDLLADEAADVISQIKASR